MKINLRSLSRVISQKFGIAESTVEKVLKSFIHEVAHKVKGGDSVHIKNFGVFSMKTRKGRDVIDPKSKQRISYQDMRVPKVKFSGFLRKLFNPDVDK